MKKPDYLSAFFSHPYNRVSLMVAGCGAIFASMPYGWQGLALVSVLALGTEVLAALTIPVLPAFKAWVDNDHHKTVRAERRLKLFAELSNHGDSQALSNYKQMNARVQTLHETAVDTRTTLTREDVEKLEDLTVDYLGLCVVNLSLKDRKNAANDDVVAKRIASTRAQLQSNALSVEETRQLRAALNEYTEILNRSRRLAVRRSALEAMLLSMPDKIEEVYQMVATAPYSTENGGKLEESLSRLRIAEEVAAEFSDVDYSRYDFSKDNETPLETSTTAIKTPTAAARRMPGSIKH